MNVSKFGGSGFGFPLCSEMMSRKFGYFRPVQSIMLKWLPDLFSKQSVKKVGTPSFMLSIINVPLYVGSNEFVRFIIRIRSLHGCWKLLESTYFAFKTNIAV